ncbi:hypothetical protein FOZ60_004220 [Perkinsus olseni]|uniref:Uncharacterized protein n=1 Tax=Perkinsus olseni TaxID=32597 RepID=A0A7J6NVW4_PEROL|nr:hypothetical protein FOZ60_004220 [Perkinsus olseni]
MSGEIRGIGEPEGAAEDWAFRDAVREEFGIHYHKSLKSWFYWLPEGGTRGKKCIKPGVLNALRFLCEDKAKREEAERLGKGSVTAVRHRKRKHHETIQSPDSESSTPSDSESATPADSESGMPSDSESGMPSDSESASPSDSESGAAEPESPVCIGGYRLRRRVSSLEYFSPDDCTLEEEIVESRGEAGSSQSLPGVKPDRVSTLTAQVEELKGKLRAKEKECEAGVDEVERLREINKRQGTARKEEMRALREETASLRKMLSDVQREVKRMKTEDGRILALQKTCQDTLSGVNSLLNRTGNTQASHPSIEVKAEVIRQRWR